MKENNTQREIKFRAWDKKRKMFLRHDGLFAISNCSTYNHEDGSITLPIGLCNPYQTDKENTQEMDVVFLQSTGLRDKNGVEIFEGDIVSFGGAISPIEYDRGCFYMSTYPGGNSLYSLLDIKYHDKSEVTGNIYENPELLSD